MLKNSQQKKAEAEFVQVPLAYLTGSAVSTDFASLRSADFVEKISDLSTEDKLSTLLTAMKVKATMVAQNMLGAEELIGFVDGVALGLDDCLLLDGSDPDLQIEIERMNLALEVKAH